MADLLARAQAALASRFRVERELGRGGMATVFLAEDLKHNRLLAVKILHPDLAAAIGPERFRDEIDFAAHLNHPHILPLIDSGEDAGLLWYAMPYVEGETLRQRLLHAGRLPLAEVADLVQQVAAAMDYAHGRGILHRDIKPENLLLAHGHVWVADFGIAKALKGAEAAASGAFEAGTPGYMSPEQMAGEPVDRRTDIFSLGAVVYEALTGRQPFPDFERKKDLFGRRRKPGRLIRARPDVPPLMEAAVRRALSAVPAERQDTAGELAEALTKAVTDPKVERAARTGWLSGGLVTFGVFAALLAAYWFLTRPPEYDDNRVVILPVQGPGRTPATWGEDLAVALEAQLNSTRFLVARSATGDTSSARAAGITRSRYSIQPQAFSDGTLQVTLWDHEGSLGEKETFRVPDDGLVFTRAVEIAKAFLPRLMPTGGQVDQSVFGQRSVEALAAFLQGERAYRSGSFAMADTLFSQAVQLDSAFTWAALRGAQAASWNTEHERALTLIQQALKTTDSLGPRYAAFARGLEDYQEGQADSAIVHLREAIRLDSLWAEAHMAMAEVYHHYLPQEGAPLDSAWRYFTAARAFDPTFTPPVFHLIQLAVWRGDAGAADSLLTLFERTDPAASNERVQAGLMVACARGENSDARWREAMEQHPISAAQAAVWLAVGGLRQGSCAARGLRLVPDSSDYGPYAPAVLAHILAAQGDSAGLREVLGTSRGLPSYTRSYIAIGVATAGLPIGQDLVDSAVARTLFRMWLPGDSLPGRRLQNRWLLGSYALLQSDLTRAEAWIDSLRAMPLDGAPEHSAQRERFVASLAGRVALARGDTTLALTRLEHLSPGVTQGQLRWSPWHAYAHERMLRVRIYQARGNLARAADLATSFDSPASFGLLLYLPESLRRRQTLAESRGQMELSRALAERRAALGSGLTP